jgi:hypothetical protein
MTCLTHHLVIAILLLPTGAIMAQAPSEPALPAAVAEPIGSWFGAAELSILRAKVRPSSSGLHGGVPLDVTVSPEVTLGYRFASGHTIHFDYSYFSSSGTRAYDGQPQVIGVGPNDEILTEFRPYVGRGDLSMHRYDLDFTFRDPAWKWLPFLRTRWQLGLRALDLSSDAIEPKTFDDRFLWGVGNTGTEWFGDERHATRFSGLGPHFDYKIAVAIDTWGLEFFALSDVAAVFGTRTSRFSPVNPQPVRNGVEVGPGYIFTAEVGDISGLVPARPITEHRFACTGWNWRGDLGARWTRPWGNRIVTVAAGYRMDFWTFGGKSSGGGGAASFWGGTIRVPDLSTEARGVFLRLEVKY